MAIEDEDIRDREHWTVVSREWYSKASDMIPNVGRLCHHRAILAQPSALQQVFYYGRSLVAPIPFQSAKESIMTLFNPILRVSPSPDLSSKLLVTCALETERACSLAPISVLARHLLLYSFTNRVRRTHLTIRLKSAKSMPHMLGLMQSSIYVALLTSLIPC